MVDGCALWESICLICGEVSQGDERVEVGFAGLVIGDRVDGMSPDCAAPRSCA